MSPAKKPRRRRGRGKGGGAAAVRQPQHTSRPTSRTAYVETREWLIKRHGSVCAYCTRKVSAATITLDHVTPRKGQTAYDRRDNLVLCCKACNAKKADQAFLSFLLARRERAVHLLTYGDHLSHMLIEMIRDIAGPEAVARHERLKDPDYPYRD